MRKLLKKLVTFLGLGVVTLVAGCAEPKVSDTGPKDTGVYFDYAGVYVTAVEMKFTDNNGADESGVFDMELLIEQNGPAMTTSGILGRALEAGMLYDHTTTADDSFWGEVYTKTYSGSSAEEDPMTIALHVEADYPDLDYSWVYDYTLTLGEKLVF